MENPRYVSTIDQSEQDQSKRVPVSLHNKFVEKKMKMRLNVSSQHELHVQQLYSGQTLTKQQTVISLNSESLNNSQQSHQTSMVTLGHETDKLNSDLKLPDLEQK